MHLPLAPLDLAAGLKPFGRGFAFLCLNSICSSSARPAASPPESGSVMPGAERDRAGF